MGFLGISFVRWLNYADSPQGVEVSDKHYMDLLKLTHRQALAILEEIATKAAGHAGGGSDHREYERLPFSEEALLLCKLQSIDRGVAVDGPAFLVKCVDISEGGMGFLHGAYVHVGTPCVVTLIARQKTGFRVSATVARCQHVRGHIHIIGVKFDEPMEVAQIESLKTQA